MHFWKQILNNFVAHGLRSRLLHRQFLFRLPCCRCFSLLFASQIFSKGKNRSSLCDILFRFSSFLPFLSYNLIIVEQYLWSLPLFHFVCSFQYHTPLRFISPSISVASSSPTFCSDTPPPLLLPTLHTTSFTKNDDISKRFINWLCWSWILDLNSTQRGYLQKWCCQKKDNCHVTLNLRMCHWSLIQFDQVCLFFSSGFYSVVLCSIEMNERDRKKWLWELLHGGWFVTASAFQSNRRD